MADILHNLLVGLYQKYPDLPEFQLKPHALQFLDSDILALVVQISNISIDLHSVGAPFLAFLLILMLFLIEVELQQHLIYFLHYT